MAPYEAARSVSLMERWARSVVRFRRGVVVAWFVAAGGVFWSAPRIPALLHDDTAGFLPAQMPSQRGLQLVFREFPDGALASRVAVVFARGSGMTDADRAYVARVSAALAARADELDWRVRAAATAPFLRPLLESSDGKAAMVVVELPAGNLTHHSVRRARIVQETLAGLTPPAGLRVEVTGDAALGELLDRTAKRDVDMTTLWAFFAVVAILLLVYRSPVAMLLPLASISTALMLSLGLIGWAAAKGLPVNGLVEMFVVVIVVGSGVDYCLFVFARYREEMALRLGTGSPDERDAIALSRVAVVSAVTHTGGAVLASAGTNAVGLATLILARNRDLATSGPLIACSVVIATLAVLTLVPALMCVVGPRWMASALHRTREDGKGRLWPGVARLATRSPGLVTVLLVIVLAIPALIAGRAQPLYDNIEEYPADSSFVQGATLYQTHFLGGRAVADVTVLLSSASGAPLVGDTDRLCAVLEGLEDHLTRNLPIAYFRSLHAPLGEEAGASVAGGGLSNGLVASLASQLARAYYVGRSQGVVRVDLGLAVAPRSPEALDLVPRVGELVSKALPASGLFESKVASGVVVDLVGETAYYHDLRALRARDFRVVAAAVVVLVFAILHRLTRSAPESAILIGATLLTYFTTYGATWMIVRVAWGVEGLGWQLDFLLFIIILSLGQDYNIFVVARIHEELQRRGPRQAVERAICKTGRVVSSCGLIMAATFASMFSGSLLVLKEFAVALSLGILIDTFAVRPLLVPSMILLLYRMRPPHRGGRGVARGPATRVFTEFEGSAAVARESPAR